MWRGIVIGQRETIVSSNATCEEANNKERQTWENTQCKKYIIKKDGAQAWPWAPL